MTYRVIQWSTGNVGRYALRGIINHPELDLVGLWVHSEKKAGMDAGELAGVGPVGVIATNDAEALLALDADVVVYNATGDLRPHEAVEDTVRILDSGKNVVGTALVPMVYPPSAPEQMRDPIQEACLRNNVSCFTSGIDPGVANDLLPLVITGLAERIDSVRVQEILNYATYDQPEVLFHTMGFAKPLDHTPILLLPGVLSLAWGCIVNVIAAGLGVELDEIREVVVEKVPAPETFEVPSGTVEKGTMAGLRFEIQGIVGGEVRIVVEHITRLREDIAPHWPPPPGKGGYKVRLEGSPTITLTLEMEGDGGDENSGGLIVTATRLLNSIPAVVNAPPGVLSALDLPLITGKGLMR
ncbi:MAG: diacylglycerol kinase [Actinomycetota bacterium]